MHNLKLIWEKKLSGKTEILNSWKSFPYLESVEKPKKTNVIHFATVKAEDRSL